GKVIIGMGHAVPPFELDNTFKAKMDADGLCDDYGTSMNNRIAKGSGFLNDEINFTGFPVVGFNHHMQVTGGCQDYHQKSENQSLCSSTKIMDKNQSICSWDQRVDDRIKFDLEIRIPLS
ncbi:hypothetical protein KI387_019823, partial [Taxus chinensis]